MGKMGAEERARTVHFAQRLYARRYPVVVVGLLLVLAGATAIGPATLVPAAGIAAVFSLLGWAIPRTRRPELVLLAAFVAIQLLIVGVLAAATTIQLDLLCLLMLPATAACIVFPTKLMVGTSAFTIVLMIAAAFLIDPDRVLDDPPVLLIPLGVMITVTLPAAMIRRLELRSLTSTTTDALTGALNRSALEARIVALSEQAHSLPLRVGVVMADLDHFKRVNDELGHDAGDRVLKEVVHRIRAAVGPLTPVYRIGGEEFVVLLAGAVEAETTRVAEQLRRAVASAPIEGRDVTISGGAAAGTLDHYDIQTVIRAADDALYEAKRGGRNRIAVGNLAQMFVLGELPSERAEAPAASEVQTGRREILPLRSGPRQPTPDPQARPTFTGPKGNWLVRGEFEREHMRELARSLNTTHRVALGAVFVALLASIPWMGWQLLVPAAFAVPGYHVAQRRVASLRRPEYVLGAAWFGVQFAIFLGAMLATDPTPYMLTLFVPMLVGLCAVFPSRGAAILVGITSGLVILSGLIMLPSIAMGEPGIYAPFIGTIAAVAMMSSVAGRASIDYRTQAVVDPLTGALTRGALRARLAELEAGEHVAGGNVAVIAFDIDHFKQVNDTRGHAAGDDVLAAVGASVRSELRALEWAFRLGGDEFVIVLPGSTRRALELAERLRVAIGRTPVGTDLRVTASFGVAVSEAGEWFDFDAVVRQADAALYEAKRAGRDRVAVAASGGDGPSLLAKTVSAG